MKKLLSIATLLATLLTATAFSGTAGAAGISHASLDKLLQLSGINDLVAEFPVLLRLRIAQARQRDRFAHSQPSMSDDEYRQLEHTMLAAFKPAGILKAIGKQVSQSVSEQDAGKMLAWYGSALGRKIGKAEEASVTPEAMQDMAASAHRLLADKPRVIYALELDKLLHMTDMSMRFQANAAVAMFVAFSTKKNTHRPANPTAFRKRIAASLQRQRPLIRRAVIISTVYTYRNIDMKDLEAYRTFLGLPSALRLNRALMAGMDAGMDQAIDRMSRAVESLFKQRHLQQI
jgi:hypothetical protein